MGDEILIGNVRFYRDDIVRNSVHYDENGGKFYSVFLKNGTNLTFRDQSSDAGAYVMTGRDAGNENKEGTAFFGIKGLSIQGSKKDDYYHLMDCDYYNVDVRDGGRDEVRIVNRNGEPESAATAKDVTDNVYTIDASKVMSMSEGFFVRNLEPRTKVPPQTKPSENATKTLKDNLANLQKVASIVTKQNNELIEYKDADGNTVVRVDYSNDDPEEFFAEEEVRSPEGRLISYTTRFSDGNGVNGFVGFDKYVYDENENLSKVVTTEYENGKFVSTKEVPPTQESERRLVGFVAPGIVIEDTEMRDFLRARGITIAGNL